MSGSASPGRVAGRSLRDLYRGALKLDRTQSDPIIAARNAFGLVLALGVPAAVGSVAAGAQSGVGAIQTAFADRPGPYRLRVMRMLVCDVIAAVTAGAAAALGQSLIASALLLAVCSSVAGMMVIFGPSATQVGIAATATALVVGHIAESPDAALRTALFVLAGGAVQIVLAIGAWPLGRHRPERRALGGLYHQLAQLAAAPVEQTVAPPLGFAVDYARDVLTGAGHDHGPSVESYRVLLDQALRARRDILALSAYAARLGAEGRADPRERIQNSLALAARVLERIAEELVSGHGSSRDERLAGLDAVAEVRNSAQSMGDSLTERAAADRLSSLASQLAAMMRTSRTGATEGRIDEEEDSVSGASRMRDPWAVLRANLDSGSPALRHAVRLGVLIPLSDVLSRGAGMERGYWISLTILVVLRPDFGATFQRVLLRVAGTILGLGAAGVIVYLLPAGSTTLTFLLIGVLFFGLRLAGPNNSGIGSVCLSALVVLLLSLVGQSPSATELDRAVATVIGGLIAVGASLFLPKWEHTQLTARLAELVGAYRDYLQALVADGSSAATRSAARARSRLARSNAEASLDRARAEPVDAQGALEVGAAVLANTHRLAHALSALDASRLARRTYVEIAEFRVLVDAVLDELEDLRSAVSSGRSARETSLRHFQTDFERSYAASTAPTAPPSGRPALAVRATVVEACDRIVVSVDTIAATLAESPIPSV